MPLPDYPMRWMKREDAIKEGYLPFAGFFLPHEYGMLPGFMKDLDAAGREYCGVRDLKYCKGIEVFAKNGNKNFYTTEQAQRGEDYKTEAATEPTGEKARGARGLKTGVQEATEGESGVRTSQETVAGGEA